MSTEPVYLQSTIEIMLINWYIYIYIYGNSQISNQSVSESRLWYLRDKPLGLWEWLLDATGMFVFLLVKLVS